MVHDSTITHPAVPVVPASPAAASGDDNLTGVVAGYTRRVENVLRSAMLLWSGVMPVVQFVAFVGEADSFDHRALITAAFVVHGLCWVATLTRSGPSWCPVVTWGLVCLTLAISVGPEHMAQRIVLTACISMGVASALVCTRQTSVVAAVLLSVCAAVAMFRVSPAVIVESQTRPGGALIYYALLPVYTVCTTLAVGYVTQGLTVVAELADRHHSSRLRTERAVARKLAVARMFGKRSRVLHDTVINTLGAVARGVVSSDPVMVRQRCATDVAAIDDLERSRLPEAAGLVDVLAYARALDMEIRIDHPDRLDAMLLGQPAWRRHEIVFMIVELINNAAKHSGTDLVEIELTAATGSITVRDRGVGVADLDSLRQTLGLRALDAMVDVDVESAPRQGTAVTIRIPPLESVDGQNVLTQAASAMASRLAAVMAAEFLIVAVLTTQLQMRWSVAEVAPAAVLWGLVVVLLVVVTVGGRHRPHLSPPVIAAGYLLLMAAAGVVMAASHMAAPGRIVNAGDAVPANMAWMGDAAATACIVFVVVDGRPKVYLPPVVASVGVACAAMIAAGRPASSAVSVLVGDAMIVTLFVLVRRGLQTMAAQTEREHRAELRRREEQERHASQVRFRTAEGSSMLARSRELLCGLAAHPERVADPAVRATAACEESYLRALIAMPDEPDRGWARIISAARSAGVVLDLHVFNADRWDADAFTPSATQIDSVVAAIGRCGAGEPVSVSVFDSGAGIAVDVVADSLPDGFAEIGAER